MSKTGGISYWRNIPVFPGVDDRIVIETATRAAAVCAVGEELTVLDQITHLVLQFTGDIVQTLLRVVTQLIRNPISPVSFHSMPVSSRLQSSSHRLNRIRDVA